MSEEKVLNGEHCEDLKERELPNELPYEAIETDPALDRRITRKFDTHVVPWLFGLWLLAFIDRSNIGNARIDGLNTDLKLDGDKFNIALTVFYVPYILIGVPSNWALKHVGAGYYLPGLLIGWGTVSVCLGAVKTYGGLITARFFLGLCEGGLLGGMVLYLSMFYRRHDLLFRLGLFYCAAPLSGAFGGLLATGLAEIHFHGYNRWPWIFFVEGAISVLFGILTIYFLPHTPMQAKCLTEEERVVAVARMKLDAHGASNKSNVESEHFAWPWVRMAVLNWNTVLLSLNFFAIITPIYSFSLFLPYETFLSCLVLFYHLVGLMGHVFGVGRVGRLVLPPASSNNKHLEREMLTVKLYRTIISSLGYSSVKAQLFTVPPNMGGFFMVIIGTYLSDKIKMRGPIMIVGCLLAIIGYIMLLVPAHPLVHYGG